MKIVRVESDDEVLRACQQRYFEEISVRFGVAFDPYAGEDEQVANAREWHLLATDNGVAIACGSLRDLGEGTAEVKRVWVDGEARGKGVAGALMDALEAIVSREGFSRVVLDTNKTLTEARAMYSRRGYREIERYNDNPFADHFFEKVL